MFALPMLLFTVIAVLVIAHRRLQPYYATLEALSTQFQGGLSKLQRYLLHQPCFIGTYSGYNFSVKYISGKSYVFGLAIACKLRSSSKLKIFMYDKNPTHVFLAERIEIGDHNFDNYFIYSNMPEEAKKYFANDSRKNNIKQLLSIGWEPPNITGNEISVLAVDRRPSPNLDPKLVEATLRNLIELQIEHI